MRQSVCRRRLPWPANSPLSCRNSWQRAERPSRMAAFSKSCSGECRKARAHSSNRAAQGSDTAAVVGGPRPDFQRRHFAARWPSWEPCPGRSAFRRAVDQAQTRLTAVNEAVGLATMRSRASVITRSLSAASRISRSCDDPGPRFSPARLRWWLLPPYGLPTTRRCCHRLDGTSHPPRSWARPCGRAIAAATTNAVVPDSRDAIIAAGRPLRERLRHRRGARGYLAVSQGLVAVGSGDVVAARRLMEEASRIAPNEPLPFCCARRPRNCPGTARARHAASK